MRVKPFHSSPADSAGRLLVSLALLFLIRMNSWAGSVVAWGNGAGFRYVPDGLSGITAIAGGGRYDIALKQDGTVVAWGNATDGETQIPSGLTGVTAVAAGFYHVVALKQDGSVVAWGRNDFGQSTVPPNLRSVKAIAAGGVHSLALKQDGTVVAWGASFAAGPIPGNLSRVKAIAAGSEFCLALKEDGTVVGWGANFAGQTTPPPNLRNVKALAAGNRHSVALKQDGTVVGWGNSGNGAATVPNGLTDVVAISSFGDNNLALRRNGTIAAWRSDSLSLNTTVPAGLSKVTAIAAGNGHFLALKAGSQETPLSARSNIECGCETVGDYLAPSPPVPLAAESSGGNYVVQKTKTLGGYRLQVIRIADGKALVDADVTENSSHGFSPDGQAFLYDSIGDQVASVGFETLALYDLAASGSPPLQPVWRFETLASSSSFGFSPHGRYFALFKVNGQDTGWLKVIDIPTGRPKVDTTIHFFLPPIQGIGLSGWGFGPDTADRSFVYGYTSGPLTTSLNLYNLATAQTVLSEGIQLRGNPDSAATWQFSPCGDLLGVVTKSGGGSGEAAVGLHRTLNGSAVQGSFRTFQNPNPTLAARAASHVATVGGIDNAISPNAAAEPCVISARPFAIESVAGQTVVLSVAKLVQAATDPDGDSLTFAGVQARSLQGGTITPNGPALYYDPPSPGFTGNDSFTYDVADGRGNSTTATVSITVLPDGRGTGNMIKLQPQPDGSAVLRFVGIAGRTYTIQWTDSLNPPTWRNLASRTAGANGVFEAVDPNAGNSGSRFYQILAP